MLATSAVISRRMYEGSGVWPGAFTAIGIAFAVAWVLVTAIKSS